MSDDHIKSEIGVYLAGGLPESRNRQIEAHAAACEKCRQALAKARAKQARQKREALKKASPDPMPNLFLARQGKEAGVDASPSRAPRIVAGLLLLTGASYGFYRFYAAGPHAPDAPAAEPAPAAVASVPAVSSATAAAPATVPVTPAPTPPPTAAPQPLQAQKEWKGSDSGVKDARILVVRTTPAWDRLWTEMQKKEPLPPVQFDREVVVGIFIGERPASAAIALGRITEQDNDVTIPYRVTGLDVAVSTTSAPAHPYLLSLIPRANKKIHLTQREIQP